MRSIEEKDLEPNFREEIDIVTNTDELLPPGFENDDSEGEIDASDFDNPSFPRPPPEPPDDEFDLEPEVIPAVMKNIDELNEDECFDPGGEIDVSTNDEDDDYFPFMFVIRIFLPYLICSKMFLSFLSAKSEDTIFDPEIPSGEIKVHIEVLSVLWGNRLPIQMVRCRCLGKDYAQTVKTGQHQSQDFNSTPKVGSTGIFLK
nr:hypothetical protein [Tanacetum cinerariifolium]